MTPRALRGSVRGYEIQAGALQRHADRQDATGYEALGKLTIRDVTRDARIPLRCAPLPKRAPASFT
jgi:hypothetical protein